MTHKFINNNNNNHNGKNESVNAGASVFIIVSERYNIFGCMGLASGVGIIGCAMVCSHHILVIGFGTPSMYIIWMQQKQNNKPTIYLTFLHSSSAYNTV